MILGYSILTFLCLTMASRTRKNLGYLVFWGCFSLIFFMFLTFTVLQL